ncbi:kelch domain-containing protein 1 isoform X3 [Fundulus heteroclitus]|nr:kelch domain-containing protein 1 isoform X3 [Fundulus heteroclitus]
MTGDVPPSMSGTCGCSLNGHLYIFGGCDDRGQTNQMFAVDLTDGKYAWKKIIPEIGSAPTPRDKLSCWVYNGKLIYFGGYGQKTLAEISIWKRNFILDESSFVICFVEGKSAHTARIRHFQKRKLKLGSVCRWGICFGDGTMKFTYLTLFRAAGPDPEPTAVLPRPGQPTPAPRWDAEDTCLEAESRKPGPTTFIAWILNPGPGLKLGRSWHTLTAVSETSLFLFGGLSDDCKPMSDGWLFDVETKKWREVEHPYKDKPRLWHTACAGRDSDVIVFGGSCDYILLVDTGHSNDALVFQLQPHPLFRICEDYIAKNVRNLERLRNQIPRLPPKLLKALQRRMAFYRPSKKQNNS